MVTWLLQTAAPAESSQPGCLKKASLFSFMQHFSILLDVCEEVKAAFALTMLLFLERLIKDTGYGLTICVLTCHKNSIATRLSDGSTPRRSDAWRDTLKGVFQRHDESLVLQLVTRTYIKTEFQDKKNMSFLEDSSNCE